MVFCLQEQLPAALKSVALVTKREARLLFGSVKKTTLLLFLILTLSYLKPRAPVLPIIGHLNLHHTCITPLLTGEKCKCRVSLGSFNLEEWASPFQGWPYFWRLVGRLAKATFIRISLHTYSSNVTTLAKPNLENKQ